MTESFLVLLGGIVFGGFIHFLWKARTKQLLLDLDTILLRFHEEAKETLAARSDENLSVDMRVAHSNANLNLQVAVLTSALMADTVDAALLKSSLMNQIKIKDDQPEEDKEHTRDQDKIIRAIKAGIEKLSQT